MCEVVDNKFLLIVNVKMGKVLKKYIVLYKLHQKNYLKSCSSKNKYVVLNSLQFKQLFFIKIQTFKFVNFSFK